MKLLSLLYRNKKQRTCSIKERAEFTRMKRMDKQINRIIEHMEKCIEFRADNNGIFPFTIFIEPEEDYDYELIKPNKLFSEIEDRFSLNKYFSDIKLVRLPSNPTRPATVNIQVSLKK